MNTRSNQADPNNQPPSHTAMDSRAPKSAGSIPQSHHPSVAEGNCQRSFSEGFASSKQRKEATTSGYFSIESMLVLVGLTASLLILPLMLPTLPPPPLLLLMVPIAIFGLLMAVAFMPSNVKDLTYT